MEFYSNWIWDHLISEETVSRLSKDTHTDKRAVNMDAAFKSSDQFHTLFFAPHCNNVCIIVREQLFLLNNRLDLFGHLGASETSSEQNTDLGTFEGYEANLPANLFTNPIDDKEQTCV